MGAWKRFEFLLPSVQKIGDKLERAAIANDLAGYLGVDAAWCWINSRKRRPIGAGREGCRRRRRRSRVSSFPRLRASFLIRSIASAEVREEILPLLAADLIADFATREIFETLRAIAESGTKVTFSGLDARLSPALQTLLHSVVAADDIDDDALEAARACVRKLESSAMKRRVDELRGRIKSAEREGRMAEALELMAELGRLEKEVKREQRRIAAGRCCTLNEIGPGSREKMPGIERQLGSSGLSGTGRKIRPA